MTSVTVYLRDFGNELVSTGIPCQDASTNVERAALINAIQLWSQGENDGAIESLIVEARVGNGAASPTAQSGIYAYIVMKDSVSGSLYRERVPMPQLTKATDVDGDSAWLSEVDSSGNSIAVANPVHADYQTLKTAIDATYRTPNGNSATMQRLYVPNKF